MQIPAAGESGGDGGGFQVCWWCLHALALRRFRWHAVPIASAWGSLAYIFSAGFEPFARTFDKVLIRPLDPYLSLIAQMFNIGYHSHLLLSATIMTWSLTQIEVSWTIPLVLYLVASVLSGSVVVAAIFTFIGAWSLTVVRTDAILNLMYSTYDFIRFPITIFGTAIQVFLTVVVPVALTNFYPAAMILGKDTGVFPPVFGWCAPLLGPALMYVAYRRFNTSIALSGCRWLNWCGPRCGLEDRQPTIGPAQKPWVIP